MILGYLCNEAGLLAKRPAWPAPITDAFVMLTGWTPGLPAVGTAAGLEARVTAIKALCPKVNVYAGFWIGGMNPAAWSDVAAWDNACLNVALLAAAVRGAGAHGILIDAEVGPKNGPMPKTSYPGSVPMAKHRAQEVVTALHGLPVAVTCWFDDLAHFPAAQAFYNVLSQHTTFWALDEGSYVADGSSHWCPSHARLIPGAVATRELLNHGKSCWLYDPRHLLV